MISLSETLQLQDIKLEDHSKLSKLMKRIYPPAYKHLWKYEDCNWYLYKSFGFANFKKELHDTNAAYYFIISHSKTIGILRIVFNQTSKEFPDQLTTYLHRIYLSKEAQGKGIAQQVFNWVEKIAKQNNNKHIWLEAMDTQHQALAFYTKQGYKKIHSKQLHFEGIHEHLRGMLIMSKSLQ